MTVGSGENKQSLQSSVTYFSGDPWAPGREVTRSTVSTAALERFGADRTQFWIGSN